MDIEGKLSVLFFHSEPGQRFFLVSESDHFRTSLESLETFEAKHKLLKTQALVEPEQEVVKPKCSETNVM